MNYNATDCYFTILEKHDTEQIASLINEAYGNIQDELFGGIKRTSIDEVLEIFDQGYWFGLRNRKTDLLLAVRGLAIDECMAGHFCMRAVRTSHLGTGLGRHIFQLSSQFALEKGVQKEPLIVTFLEKIHIQEY
jgi:hypothetical protein